MNIEQKDTGLLINEWQLGQQLNTAVHNGNREKFNLLLSLLSDDARDFSQFDASLAAQPDSPSDQVDLRETFSLATAQPLVNEGMSPEQALVLNNNLENQNLSSIRLQLLLNNEAILSRSDDAIIDSDVVDNLTFLSQQRLVTSLQSAAPADKHLKNDRTGVNYQLMQDFSDLDFDSKPIKVTYM